MRRGEVQHLDLAVSGSTATSATCATNDVTWERRAVVLGTRADRLDPAVPAVLPSRPIRRCSRRFAQPTKTPPPLRPAKIFGGQLRQLALARPGRPA